MNERGMQPFAAISLQVAWQTEMLAGDYAAAARTARQECEQLEQLGEQGYLSTGAVLLADALYALGRYEESDQWALRDLARAVRRCPAGCGPWPVARWLG
jgi:hypothetical protein